MSRLGPQSLSVVRILSTYHFADNWLYMLKEDKCDKLIEMILFLFVRMSLKILIIRRFRDILTKNRKIISINLSYLSSFNIKSQLSAKCYVKRILTSDNNCVLNLDIYVRDSCQIYFMNYCLLATFRDVEICQLCFLNPVTRISRKIHILCRNTI